LKIFVISLSDEHERRARIRAELERLGLDFEFFDAIRGNDDPTSHFARTSNWQYQLNTLRSPLPNEVGCYASHLSLWKKCIELGESVVVMEDDFVASADFPAAIDTSEALIARYGFIRFESFRRASRLTRSRRGAVNAGSAAPFDIYFLADPPLCMTAYAISPAAARSLVAASATLVGPVDKFMQRTWQHGVPLFAFDPATISVSEHGDTSTIGSRRQKSRNPLLLLARLVYKAIGRAQRGRFNARQFDTFGIPPGGADQ